MIFACGVIGTCSQVGMSDDLFVEAFTQEKVEYLKKKKVCV